MDHRVPTHRLSAAFICTGFVLVSRMSLSADIIKKLNRKFEPATTTQFRYRSNDVVVQADEEGNAIRAFIGKANSDGIVKGDRYSRVPKKDNNVILSKTIGKEKAKLHDTVQKIPYLKILISPFKKLLRTLRFFY